MYDLCIASNPKSRGMFESMIGSFRRGGMEVTLCQSKERAEEMLNTIKKSRQELSSRYE